MKLDAGHIRDAVRDLIDAKETKLGVEIVVPVAYPGGDLITVIIESADGKFLIHDSSAGAMRVTASGLRLSASLTARAKNLAESYQCSFISGRVSQIANPDDVAIAIALVANASRAIADLSTEPRKHTDVEFRSEVTERLRAIVGDRIRENEEVKGGSGRTYRLPAIVLDRSFSKPEHFFATVTSRSSVLNHFAEFYDLKDAYSDVRNQAVYDEHSDIRSEDRSLLKRVCELIAFDQTKIRFKGMFGDAVQNTN